MNGWKTNVFATHEEAQNLAAGRQWPGNRFPGVALPDVKALNKWIMIRYKSNFTCALVWDVGPWCVDDSSYVFGITRPRAELLRGSACPRTTADPNSYATVADGKGGFRKAPISNGGGIDLFPFTAELLGIQIGENVCVDWRFVEL